MSLSFPELVGNDSLRERLATGIRAGTLSHAYILEGDTGTGKHTLALMVAAALACEARTDENAPLPCGHCPACRKILSGRSPDILTVRREEGKAQIGVDSIRRMREDLRLLPNDLDQKVYLIEDADTMNQQAQNAFLLSLEEPPPYVLFFLLCTSARSLLETIRSRAPVLRTEPLDTPLLETALCQKSPAAKTLREADPTAFQDLVVAAGGSLGRALTLIDDKQRKPLERHHALTRQFLTLVAASAHGKDAVDWLMSLPAKREELSEQLSDITVAVRDLMLIKRHDAVPLCFFSNREEAFGRCAALRTDTLIALYNALSEAQERLSLNANIRLTLYAFAMKCNLL